MVDVERRTVVEVVVTGVAKVEVASFVFEQPVLVVVEDLVGAKALIVCSVQPFVVILVEELLACLLRNSLRLILLRLRLWRGHCLYNRLWLLSRGLS